MLTIRHFGERASADYLAGKICGVVHCYIGEEVKASASAAPSTAATELFLASRPRLPHQDLNHMIGELYGTRGAARRIGRNMAELSIDREHYAWYRDLRR